MNEDLKQKATSGLIWTITEKLMTQGISFVIGIIMARLLMPEDYGYVVIATTFISVAEALVEGGLSSALIQRKDVDEGHRSTMFFYMIASSLVFYAIMFVAAPLVAIFYEVPLLTVVIRIYAVTLPIGAVRSFLMAVMQKELKFKLQFFSSLIGTVVAGVVGIYMAFSGYGIWALVAYMLIDKVIDVVVMWIALKWVPRVIFSFKKLRELLSFATYSLGWQLVNQYTNLVIELLIGKRFTVAELSYYNRGKQYPFLMCNIINNAIGTTLFPVLSKIGDSNNQLKEATRRSIKVVTFIQLPMLFGFAAVAEPLIRWMLTEKWIFCVPYLQVTCVAFAFWPYVTCYSNAIDASGAVKVKFQKEIILTVLKILICGGALFISPFAVAVAYMIMWGLDAAITGVCVGRLIDYKISEQIKDVLPNYIGSIAMALGVYFLGMLVSIDIIKLILQVMAGIIIYVGYSVVSKNENWNYLLAIVKNRVKKRANN